MSNQNLPSVELAPSATRDLRRASVRFRLDESPERRVFVIESYNNLPAQVLDVSLGGIGLLLSQPFEAGKLMFIEMKYLDIPMEFLVQVVHATQKTDGRWLVGCEFVRKLHDDELRAFLHPS